MTTQFTLQLVGLCTLAIVLAAMLFVPLLNRDKPSVGEMLGVLEGLDENIDTMAAGPEPMSRTARFLAKKRIAWLRQAVQGQRPKEIT